MNSKLDHVEFNEESKALHDDLKKKVETLIEDCKVLKSQRAQFFLQQHLEEAFFWIGKGIKDTQANQDELDKLHGGKWQP